MLQGRIWRTWTFLSPLGAVTRYHPICQTTLQWNATEADRRVRWGLPGSVVGLYVALETAPGGVTSRTFTLYKNGSATAVTLTITGTGTVNFDTTNSVSVAADDLLSIQSSVSGSPAASDCSIGIVFNLLSDHTSCHSFISSLGTGNRFADPWDHQGWGTVENNAFAIAPIPGTVTKLRVDLTAAPGGGTRTVMLTKNGVTQDGTGGTPDTRVVFGAGDTTGTWTGTLDVAAGDRVYLESESSGTPSAAVASGYVLFQSDINGMSFVSFTSSNGAVSNAGDTFVGSVPTNNDTAGWKVAETNVTMVWPVTMIAAGIWVDLEGTPGSGKSYACILRQNLGDTLAEVEIADLETANGVTQDVDLSPGDVLSLRVIPLNTPTPREIRWGIGLLDPAYEDEEEEEDSPVADDEEASFRDGEVSIPLTWMNLFKRDGDVESFAEVDLNDPPDYFHGYKKPWVLRWKPISRGLSDRTGQIEHFTFGALMSDTGADGGPRFFRALLDDPTNKYLTNSPAKEYFIDDEQRRVQGTPRLAAVGYVSDYAPRANMQMDVEGVDWIRAKFTRKRNAVQAWQPLITTTDFPDCPPEARNIPAPLIYGALGLGGADPLTTVTLTQLAQPGTPPSAFTATPTAGGNIVGVFTRFYQVRGLIGNVETEAATAVATIDGASNNAIDLAWTNPGGYSAIRLYSSDREDFRKFAMIELDGAAVDYLDEWVLPNQDGEWLNPSPWSLGVSRTNRYYVYEDLGTGSFTRPVSAEITLTPLWSEYDPDLPGTRRRRVRLTFSDTARAKRVIVFKWDYTNWSPRYIKQFDVTAGTATLDDEMDYPVSSVDIPGSGIDSGFIVPQETGQAKAVYVGLLSVTSDGSPSFSPATMAAYVVQRAASKRIGRIDYSTALQGGPLVTEDTYTRVTDGELGSTWIVDRCYVINDRTYTMIFTTLNPPPKTVLVDVDGIEDVGDGTGNLITSPALQRLHFAVNFLAPDTPWQTGPYFTADDSTFPHVEDLPLVDAASHLAADAVLQQRIPGGYETAGIIGADGERLSALDVLARFQVSGEFEQRFNRRGQDSISAEPPSLNVSPASDPDVITDVIHIIDGSFEIEDQIQSAFFNVWPYVHTKDYTGLIEEGWLGRTETRSEISTLQYDQEREAPITELYFGRNTSVQGAATIADVMARKLARYRHPLRRVRWTMSYEGLNYEPGDVVAITHIEGIGSNGWTERPVRLMRHEVDPTAGRVTLEAYDLEQVLTEDSSP